jgi:hypothetical protein
VCVQGRLTLHAHFLLNTTELTPKMLRDCLSSIESIGVMRTVLDKYLCADLPAAAVEKVLAAARAECSTSSRPDACSTWQGLRGVKLVRNEAGEVTVLQLSEPTFDVKTGQYHHPGDVRHAGRTYAAYVVPAPDGSAYEVLPSGLAREHLRYD